MKLYGIWNISLLPGQICHDMNDQWPLSRYQGAPEPASAIMFLLVSLIKGCSPIRHSPLRDESLVSL